MYSLETLAVLNEKAVKNTRPQKRRQAEVGWKAECGAGFVMIYDGNGELADWVDVSDPLDDADLVKFHQTFDGPRHIAQAVECYASQWRRIIHTTAAWAACLARYKARQYRRAA